MIFKSELKELQESGMVPVLITKDSNGDKETKFLGKWKNFRHNISAAELAQAQHIAIPIPYKVFVIDLDKNDKYSMEDLQSKVDNMLGCKLDWKNSLIQNTFSGGQHHAFSVPELSNLKTDNKIGGEKGIDFRASESGCLFTGAGYTPIHSVDLHDALTSSNLPKLPQSAISRIPKSIIRSMDSNECDFEELCAAEPREYTLIEVKDYLSRLPTCTFDGGKPWLDFGMGLWHQFRGNSEGYALFDEYNKKTSCGNYDENGNIARWNSFGTPMTTPITFDSIRGMVSTYESTLGLDDFKIEIDPVVKSLVKGIVKNFSYKIKCMRLHKVIEGEIDESEIFEVEINEMAIYKMIANSYWEDEGVRRLSYVSRRGKIINCVKDEAFKKLVKHFANPINNPQEFEEALLITKRPRGVVDKILTSLVDDILSEIQDERSAGVIRGLTCMFAINSEIKYDCSNSEVHRLDTFSPFNSPKVYNPKILKEYLSHFGNFEEVCRYIVAARFAKDRKAAFLYLRCCSGWGKGFFAGLFESKATYLEVDEVALAFSGSPSNYTHGMFRGSFISIFNEFEHFLESLKKLETSLFFSPKGKARTSTPVYCKLFMGAISADSLTGSFGARSEVISRFSMIDKDNGRLDDLPLFKENVGNTSYFDTVQTYFAELMNSEVERYVEMGKTKAEGEGQRVIVEFLNDHNISKTTGKLSEETENISSEVLDILLTHREFENCRIVNMHSREGTFIKTAQTNVKKVLRGDYIQSKGAGYSSENVKLVMATLFDPKIYKGTPVTSTFNNRVEVNQIKPEHLTGFNDAFEDLSDDDKKDDKKDEEEDF